jgi:hypothetical protein
VTRTLNDPEDCPFLRLPAEIRNQIYNCVLGGCQINVNLNDYGLWRRPQRQPYYITTIPWQPNTMIALTKVCRQIHQDTALLPFKLNTFGEAIALKVEIFRRFVLGRSNEQRAAIRTITFSFDTIIWNEAAQVFFEHNSRWEKTTGLDLLPGLRKIIFQHMDLSKFSLAQQEWFINMGREYFRGKAVELVEAGTGRKDVKIAYEGDDSETGWTWKDGKFFTTHKTPSSDLKSANGGVV